MQLRLGVDRYLTFRFWMRLATRRQARSHSWRLMCVLFSHMAMQLVSASVVAVSRVDFGAARPFP